MTSTENVDRFVGAFGRVLLFSRHSWLRSVLLLLILTSPWNGRSEETGQTDEIVCRKHLQLIYDAIQRYRVRKKDLPDRLSDLFPNDLGNQEYLVCPAARRRGLTSAGAVLRTDFSDPLTSYFYEFAPIDLPELPGQTHRDWKRRQMGLLGSEVPMVRCVGLHEKNLNLSFGGKIYESGLYWEENFAGVVPPEQLVSNALFRDEMVFRVVTIPPREPHATAAQIDLSEFYNGSLAKAWNSGDRVNHLGELKAGLCQFHGTVFDVRGVIQLGAENTDVVEYPRQVRGIPIQQKCQRLVFLHAASGTAPFGTEIARYRVHFNNAEMLERTIIYGKDVLDWWADLPTQGEPWSSLVAWTGQNESCRHQGKFLHLFRSSWENPWPHVPVINLDLLSTMSTSGAFVIAVTSEPAQRDASVNR